RARGRFSRVVSRGQLCGFAAHIQRRTKKAGPSAARFGRLSVRSNCFCRRGRFSFVGEKASLTGFWVTDEVRAICRVGFSSTTRGIIFPFGRDRFIFCFFH